MDIYIEWDGFFGLIKLISILIIPLIVGIFIGRKIN